MTPKETCSRGLRTTVRPSPPLTPSHKLNNERCPAEMAPYYKIVTSHSALPLDQALLDTMEQQNKDELQKIGDRLAEAEKQEGETEISDALRAKATYLTRIGDKVRPCPSDRSLVSVKRWLMYAVLPTYRTGPLRHRHSLWRKPRASEQGLISF